MAQVSLPDAGTLYLDACVFIYRVERLEPYRTLLQPLWREAATGTFGLVTSELIIAELACKAD